MHTDSDWIYHFDFIFIPSHSRSRSLPDGSAVDTCSIHDSVVNSLLCIMRVVIQETFFALDWNAISQSECFGFEYFVLRWNSQPKSRPVFILSFLFAFCRRRIEAIVLVSLSVVSSHFIRIYFIVAFLLWNGNRNSHRYRCFAFNKYPIWKTNNRICAAFVANHAIKILCDWRRSEEKKNRKIRKYCRKSHLLYFQKWFWQRADFPLWKCKFNDESCVNIHDQ